MGTGFGYGVSTLLLLMIKVLFVVFVIGLVIGLSIWIKNNLFTEEDKATIKNAFTFNKVASNKDTCSDCIKELSSEWKVCPYCGTEKIIINV